MLKRFCLWLVMDTEVPLGKLAPYLLGIALGSKPVKVEGADQ